MNEPIKLSKEEVAVIKKIAEDDAKQLKHWKYELERAQKNVEYWERQSNHSSALAIRYVIAE
jgi:hypothetical protein